MSGLRDVLRRVARMFGRKRPNEAEEIGLAAIRAAERLNRAVDTLREEHEDPLAYLVHRQLDRRQSALRRGSDEP